MSTIVRATVGNWRILEYHIHEASDITLVHVPTDRIHLELVYGKDRAHPRWKWGRISKTAEARLREVCRIAMSVCPSVDSMVQVLAAQLPHLPESPE